MRHLLLLALLSLGLTSAELAKLIEASWRQEGLQASLLEARAKEQYKLSATAKLKPRLDGGISATWSTNDLDVNTQPKTIIQGWLKASYTLYDSGRTQALIKEREAQAKAAGLMYDYAKETTALKITELYLQLANLEEIAEVYRQKELFLEAQHTKMELFWKAGRIALDTLEKTRAALAEVRYQNAELAWQQLQVRNLLIQLTGERVEKVTPVTFKNPVPSQTSNRADIAALQEELVAAKERTKQAKSADGPTVTLDDTLSYTQYPDFSPVKMPIWGKTVVFDQPELQNRLALNLQISLYDFGAIKAESEAARLNELAATAKLQDAKEKQDLERQTALKSLEAAAVKLTAAQHYLTAAQTSFDAARRRFEAQVSDHVAFLDALTQHYEAQALLVQARNALELEKARYYYTTGTPIKEMIQ